MIDIFRRELNSGQLLSLQTNQYTNRLPMKITVPKNGQITGRIDLASLGAFRCLAITGTFTTLYASNEAGTNIRDDGACRVSGKISDGATGRSLFEDFANLALWVSPGRVRNPGTFYEDDSSTIRSYASNQLFYPIEFDYTFDANSSILVDFKNESNADNYVELLFMGARIRSRRTLGSVRR